MREHEAYLGKNSPEVVFDLLGTFRPAGFVLKSYIPGTHRKQDRVEVLRFEEIPDFESFKSKILELSEDDERRLTGFCSLIFLDTGSRHVPMMDFSNSVVSGYGADKVKEVMEALGQKSGLILDSGRCYHFYGFDLLSGGEWLRMIQSSLEFAEIGPKYPRWQIEEGACVLRLSVSSYKPKLPVVIDFLAI